MTALMIAGLAGLIWLAVTVVALGLCVSASAGDRALVGEARSSRERERRRHLRVA